MKNKIILFILFLFQFSFSQTPGKIEYAPVGAKWVYDLLTDYGCGGPSLPANYLGYIEYLVQKDTNVTVGNQNILCKKIIVSNYKFNSVANYFLEILPYTCMEGQRYNLTFKRNDTIFWLVNTHFVKNKFYPIVVHYKQTGPNNHIWTFNSANGACSGSQYSTHPVSISTSPFNPWESLHILKIDTMFLFNDTIRRYKINLPGSLDSYANFYYENIGFSRELVPYSTKKFIGDPLLAGKLRCYYDPTYGWLNLVMGNCYYHGYPNDIHEYTANNIRFYYHDKKIYFTNTENMLPFKLKIYDVYGKKCFETMVENSEPLELNLSHGVFLMECGNKVLRFIVE